MENPLMTDIQSHVTRRRAVRIVISARIRTAILRQQSRSNPVSVDSLLKTGIFAVSARDFLETRPYSEKSGAQRRAAKLEKPAVGRHFSD